MIRFFFQRTVPIWNIVLMVSVVFAAFVLPVLSYDLQHNLARPVFTAICFAALVSLRRKSNFVITLFFVALLMEWISGILNLQIINLMAKGTNILFFLVVVGSLIYQIAIAREVSLEVILGSIIGYLLLGIVYSIFIIYIMVQDPGAYNLNVPMAPGTDIPGGTSIPLYYSFVTLATLGYGDLVPLKPYTRSLATLITISGQFYIAIIVALLVGKFSAQKSSEETQE